MNIYSRVIAVFSLILLCFTCYAQSNINTLLNGFVTPPNSSKPRVWWHWMNGNITKDGIAKDLAWMKRAGIGGFQNFENDQSTPQIVKKRLVYMDAGWKDAFQFAAKLADSLQLEMAVASSAGWSESGGPWVSAADGMKKIVWSETYVRGDGPFTGKLPNPPSTTGEFQNSSLNLTFGLFKTLPKYYQDVKVIAYKLPDSDILLSELKPKITSSGGHFDLSQLTDGDIATANLLPQDTVHGNAWIQFEFAPPKTFKSITIVGGNREELGRYLETSDDGNNFHNICYIPDGSVLQQTISIPTTTARFFRITFKNSKTPGLGSYVAEIDLHTAMRVNRFEEKAAFAIATDLYAHPTPVASVDAIAATDVLDLSDKMNSDGALNWLPPAGNWNIVRFGYSLIGRNNRPATLEATGLEVDKLDPNAVKAYFENCLNQYKDATGGWMGNKGGLQYMVTDSWEAGAQNWTNNMMNEFAKRRSYDMLPWMPVLTGHIVKSSEESDHFLWDFRKTLSELVAEYHYDQLTTILHKYGMRRYSESHEYGRAIIADGMEVKRTAAIPMSAIWMPGKSGYNVVNEADILESASVAHIYGQNLVAAESFTAFSDIWAFSPERLKPTADLALAYGLNRFVIHTSPHQPTDDKIPGLGLGPYGQSFTRHETWAEEALPWTTYLARNCYMLQQGKFVADIIYYYGEDNNITSLFQNKLPDVPNGYNFDFVNADALLNMLYVNNNNVVTHSGMRYKILALDSNSMQMRLDVVKKIRDLVKAGAIVVGPKPTGTPGLGDDKATFNIIVNELWGQHDSVKTFGSGKVFAGWSIQQVLNTLKIGPDFEYTKPKSNTELLYVHRKLPTQEFYWINNRNDREEDVEATFRIDGKSVELWHPETGKIEQASYSFFGGHTKVPLHLEPNEAIFVVFRKSTTKTVRVVTQPTEKQSITIEGSWDLNFQKNWGIPGEISIDKLISWTNNAEPDVKYFSGTGTYSKMINAPASLFKKNAQLWLDLGEVKNLAEVIVNGKSVGILWKKPFRVEVTGMLRPGENSLVIKVTNLWVNRLIGDQQKGITKKYTYTQEAFYKADSPLLPSGLLGPVRILSLQ